MRSTCRSFGLLLALVVTVSIMDAPGRSLPLGQMIKIVTLSAFPLDQGSHGLADVGRLFR
jgi:hypothetical protein